MELTDLLIVAAHPDDELLGAAGIMARAVQAGRSLRVIVATDGGASDPRRDHLELAVQRGRECQDGLARLLGAVPPLLFLDVRDGTLDAAAVTLEPAGAVGEFVRGFAHGSILVTDAADNHPDHKAAFGLAPRLVAQGIGERLLAMPISQRVDRAFDAAPFEALPVAPFEQVKREALACHRSQIDTLTGFSLAPDLVDDFCRTEYLRTVFDRADSSDDAIAADHFDSMFAGSADPWGYDDTPYERDRFARTVSALNDRTYPRALELGCANGALTRELAPLCGELLASDASEKAVAVAREQLADLAHVTVERRSVPGEVPDGPFDLIVASDFLYYLGLTGVVALMAQLDAVAARNCRMLIASYLGETDTRITGEMSSEIAIAHLPGWRRVHAERTDKLRIDVLDRIANEA